MYLWLVAAGLSLIFGVMRVLNFAHGSLYMLGAYFAWVVVRVTGSFWLALLIGPAVVAGVGWAMEFGFLRRVYSAPEAFQLLLTFAFVLMFDDAVKLVFGPVYQSPPTPAALSGAFVLGRSILPTYHLFILCVGALVGLGLWFFLEKTSFGLVIRATAADREMARALGVRSSRLFTWVFILGAALAGLGGALSMPVRAISPGMGEFIIIEAFVVVVLGGLGSLRGAFVGALLIGLLHAYGLLFMPVFELALGYLAMAAVLIVRPWGLFGARES
ncbi:MAG: branched-chain amino acid ABC transporter permease [Deltaproteobacteria bacterium]|nr:MAG: branched-chain amino acid ABC transporter permease [Deltaproteobacteria bacterium]TMA74226.1 MAG: branched-chain amino acid ABC transporter permease [Deltaproteobacteria bacterium]TMB33652.1 MAG: branched-chain amino acid ABC transporter permease [Deltaproteobacteria bacterium]